MEQSTYRRHEFQILLLSLSYLTLRTTLSNKASSYISEVEALLIVSLSVCCHSAWHLLFFLFEDYQLVKTKLGSLSLVSNINIWFYHKKTLSNIPFFIRCQCCVSVLFYFKNAAVPPATLSVLFYY